MAKYDKTRAWKEARQLIAEHRVSLSIGLALMVVNRLSGFVLPWTSKFLIDDIIGKHHAESAHAARRAPPCSRRSFRPRRRSRCRRS